MTEGETLKINTTMLAYIGDAVYELEIRKRILQSISNDVSKAHKEAIKYVSSKGQAIAAKQMLTEGILREEEERLLKRARNHRTMSKPINADAKDYKIATGLEALIGYLYLSEEFQRLQDLMEIIIKILNE